MKINRLLLIALVAVLSFVVLAACNPAVTGDVEPTAEPTATPDPLLSMDPVDRALLLYDRWANFEINSYKCLLTLATKTSTDGEITSRTTQSDVVVFNYNKSDYVEHIDTELYVGDDMVMAQESGYADGFKFIKSDTAAFKTPISAEQYVQETQGFRLMEILRPTKEKCSEISSSEFGEGTWKAYFDGYSSEICQMVFEELLGENASYDEDTMGSLEVIYVLTLSGQGYPVAEHLVISANREDERDGFVEAWRRVLYGPVNRVEEAPEIDLSQYEEVTDIQD